MSQYIGKTISLVSVTENRYVGILEGIDSEKGTVTLGDVRCFGTEGRKGWGPGEIYPNSTVYRSVKFNGNEVKDLSILDMKLEDVQPVVGPQPQPNQFHNQVPAAVAGYGVYAPSTETGNGSGVEQAQQGNPVPTTIDATSAIIQSRNRQQGLLQQTPLQHTETLSHSNPQSIPPIPDNAHAVQAIPEFDFQTNNARFVAPNAANATSDTFYNKKSSFFDTISTSTEVNTNMRWQEEKAMNMDTFGQASARPRFAGRGSRRGRGTGRGGFRGRGGHPRGKQRQMPNNSNNGNNGNPRQQKQQKPQRQQKQQHGPIEF